MFKWNELVVSRTSDHRWLDLQMNKNPAYDANFHETVTDMLGLYRFNVHHSLNGQNKANMLNYYYETFRNLSYWTWVNYV